MNDLKNKFSTGLNKIHTTQTKQKCQNYLLSRTSIPTKGFFST